MSAAELRPTDEGIIERVYYRVPLAGAGGYGPEFPGTLEGLKEAVAHAKSTIQEIDGCPDRYTRAFVQKCYAIRWLPASGQNGGLDGPIESNEIFLTEAEKKKARVGTA